MASERRWPAVSPVAFTVAGTSRGKITVSSTRGFKVKQTVVIQHPTLPQLLLEVKKVTKTSLIVGLPGKIDNVQDLIGYDTLSFVYADEQIKKIPTDKELANAVYEQEPTVANRVIQVDEQGDFYTDQNPLPVKLSGTSITIENADLNVQLDHTDNGSRPHDSVRIGDGTNELKINPDGSLNVAGLNLTGVATEATLQAINNNLQILVNTFQSTSPQFVDSTGDLLTDSNGNILTEF
jgi:hypothetical protein